MSNESDKPQSRRTALQRGLASIRAYEGSLSRELLRALNDCGATIYGVADRKRIGERVPTVCFNLPGIAPAVVTEELAKQDIGVRDGHMYSPRLMKHLGLAKESGAVRASLVHYNTLAEVHKFESALAKLKASC